MRRVKRELLVWCILGITLQCMVGCGDDESIGNGPLMGRNYVQYEQAPNGLMTGVAASILTRYGELYDHGDTTKEDIALAYCSAARVRSNYNDTIWAQMEFAHHKPRNFIVTFHSYYCEIMGDIWNMWYSSFPDGFPNPDSLSPPFEGWDYNYRCELNPESVTFPL